VIEKQSINELLCQFWMLLLRTQWGMLKCFIAGTKCVLWSPAMKCCFCLTLITIKFPIDPLFLPSLRWPSPLRISENLEFLR